MTARDIRICLANRTLPHAIALAVLLAASVCSAQDFSQTHAKPSPQAALVEQANDALAKRDFPAALKLLTDLNAQLPNDPHVLYNLAFTEDALDQSAAAEADYRKSIAADSSFPAPHAALGLLLARAGRAAEAHTELSAATALPEAEPTLKARAFRALARLDLSANPPAPQLASSELFAALKLTPETPDDILLAAELAEATPDLPAAEQSYRRYLALPGNAGSVENVAALAHILLAERHPAEAEALLTSTVAQHPGDPTLTAQLATAYLASGDPARVAEAAPLLEALHKSNPVDPNVTRLLARVYFETGHPEPADPLYAELISAQSQNGKRPDPTLLDDRAEVLIRLHRPGEAETLLKLAVQDRAGFRTPEAFGDAATRLAFAASEIDDPRMTLQALALRATVLPLSSSTLFLEAAANDALHQTGKAVEIYKKFLAEANGQFPTQESQARRRLSELEHRK